MKYITPAQRFADRIVVHPSQRQAHITPIETPLYVVTCIQNPKRFRTRYELYRRFEKYVLDSGAKLVTIELSLRDRHHEISNGLLSDGCGTNNTYVSADGNLTYIQVSTTDEMWHKENLLNIATNHLPLDWQYVAYVDADTAFTRTDWVQETLQMLQHYHVVQMFSKSLDLGPTFEPLPDVPIFNSFMASYQAGLEFPLARKGDSYYIPNSTYWHPGYAWAYRRSAINDVGGLGDIGILGSSDLHMAAALIGKIEYTIQRNYNHTYLDYWKRWQDDASKHINGNVGHVDGLLLHYFHGAKKHRNYNTRNQILVQYDFNYLTDIMKDNQGLYKWRGNKPGLRDAVRRYFAQRNEDSIEV